MGAGDAQRARAPARQGVRPAGLAKVPTAELVEFVTVCIAPREERPRARQLLKHPYFASVRSEKAAVKLSAEALLGAGASCAELHLLLAECAGSTAGSTVSRTSSEMAALEPGEAAGADAAARFPSGGLTLGVLPPVVEHTGEALHAPARPSSAPGQAPASPPTAGSAAGGGSPPAAARSPSPRPAPGAAGGAGGAPAPRPPSPPLPLTPAPTPAKVSEAAAEPPMEARGRGAEAGPGLRGRSPLSEGGHGEGESAETALEALAAASVAESYGTAGEARLAGEPGAGGQRRDSSDGGSSRAVAEPVLTGAVPGPASTGAGRHVGYGAGVLQSSRLRAA